MDDKKIINLLKEQEKQDVILLSTFKSEYEHNTKNNILKSAETIYKNFPHEIKKRGDLVTLVIYKNSFKSSLSEKVNTFFFKQYLKLKEKYLKLKGKI
jgi:hypothetical protein